MIKKSIAFICALTLLLTATSAVAFADSNSTEYTEISLEQISEIGAEDVENANVLSLSPNDVDKIDGEIKKDQLTTFLTNNGLIVYRDNDGIAASALDSYFGLGVQEVSEPKETLESNTAIDQGKDIATIYYLDTQNVISTLTINVDENSTNDFGLYDTLIEEAVDEIIENNNLQRQATTSSPEEITGEYIGKKTFIYSRAPKGKLRAQYEFYVAENVHGSNYFIVFADVNGMPGTILYEDDSSYEKGYEGEKMSVEISPITSSVTLDDYGPERTITSGSKSYAVSIGITGYDLSISRTTTYTRNIQDTEISTKCTTTDARWNLRLRGPAQKENCRFEPAATFECDDSKTNVKLNCYASYTLDSVLSAQEKISLDRDVRCTLTDVE